MMKNPRDFRSGQSGNLTCDMFGGLKIFVGDGLVMLFGDKIPTTLEIPNLFFCFIEKFSVSWEILLMTCLTHCFFFVQLLQLLCVRLSFILPMWEQMSRELGILGCVGY
jgi:hypothetical protein